MKKQKKKKQQYSHTALKVNATGQCSENKSDSKPAFGQEVCVKTIKLVHISHGLFRRAGNGITNIFYKQALINYLLWMEGCCLFLKLCRIFLQKDPCSPDATNDVIMLCSMSWESPGLVQTRLFVSGTVQHQHQWIPEIIQLQEQSPADQPNWLLFHLPPVTAWDSPHSTLRMV